MVNLELIKKVLELLELLIRLILTLIQGKLRKVSRKRRSWNLFPQIYFYYITLYFFYQLSSTLINAYQLYKNIYFQYNKNNKIGQTLLTNFFKLCETNCKFGISHNNEKEVMSKMLICISTKALILILLIILVLKQHQGF